MSQHDNKHKTDHKERDTQKLKDTKVSIENTSKKVNQERSKHDTDEKVKNKVKAANLDAPWPSL